MLSAVQLVGVDEVIGRILAAARAQPGGVVATDADGTLWDGDVGEDLFEAFIEHGRVEPPSLEGMKREAHDHGLSDAGSGPDVARRIYAAYTEGRFPEERICELMVWCFAGWTQAEVDDFARDVIERAGLAARLHGEVLRALDRLRAEGVHTVLVSASPMPVVVAGGARVGFDPAHIVAALPRFAGGVIAPHIEHPIPYGAGKVRRLREHVGDRVLYAAFGDNAFDVAMLSAARVGVAVRPKPRLRDRAHEVAGLVELRPEAVQPSARATPSS